MSDNNKLAKFATNAILGIGGALALGAASILIKWFTQPVGIAAGAIVTVIGLSGVFSRNGTDRKDGMFVTLAGAVLLCTFLGIGPIKNFASTILSAGSAISFFYGLWNGLRFFIGRGKRS
ncbi:MAG: hypothetical protein LBC77_03425 [Spirochaetaceae bacterium]|jgi:hypothetical protein|nr:hypothetical protein [Spirochaetaceae bacterium]